ncbi:MAG: ABC transporter substrate-binding protein [Ruthenibacterium sp.]
MKKSICLFLTLLLCVSVTAPAFAAVRVEPNYDYQRFANDNLTLNVYNWGEYISNGTDDSVNVVKEFEALTGIKVNYTTFDTNESLYAKLKSGAGDYDVIIPSDYMIDKMAHEDMLAEIDLQNIPNFKFIGDDYKSRTYDPENKYSVAYTWGVVGIIYNKNIVDEEDLAQGFGLLWDEKYAKQILMFNNSRDAFAVAGKMLGHSLNPKNTAEIDAAAQQLKNQKSVVQAYVMDEVFDIMGGEEAAIAPYYAGDGITLMRENENLDMFIPPEGSNLYVDAMCIPKTSKKQEAAEMFINFMCETDIALANTETICYSSPHTAVQALLPKELRENELMYPPAELLAKCEIFTALPSDISRAMDAAWSDVRSYDANGNGWLMPVALCVMLCLAGFGFVRKAMRKKRNEY